MPVPVKISVKKPERTTQNGIFQEKILSSGAPRPPQMRVISAEITLARYARAHLVGGLSPPTCPLQPPAGFATGTKAKKRNRTAKPKRQKPRLIRLRAVGTKPSREERDFRVHCPCPAGVPGGVAPWRLLVTFRRRKVTPAPAGATLPIAWGKQQCGCTAAKTNPPLRPAEIPPPRQGQPLPIRMGNQHRGCTAAKISKKAAISLHIKNIT